MGEGGVETEARGVGGQLAVQTGGVGGFKAGEVREVHFPNRQRGGVPAQSGLSVRMQWSDDWGSCKPGPALDSP